jgi:hypothetical protein
MTPVPRLQHGNHLVRACVINRNGLVISACEGAEDEVSVIVIITVIVNIINYHHHRHHHH